MHQCSPLPNIMQEKTIDNLRRESKTTNWLPELCWDRHHSIFFPLCGATIAVAVAEALAVKLAVKLAVELVVELIVELAIKLVVESVIAKPLVPIVIVATKRENIGISEAVEFVKYWWHTSALVRCKTKASGSEVVVATEGEHGSCRFPVTNAENHVGRYILVIISQWYHARRWWCHHHQTGTRCNDGPSVVGVESGWVHRPHRQVGHDRHHLHHLPLMLHQTLRKLWATDIETFERRSSMSGRGKPVELASVHCGTGIHDWSSYGRANHRLWLGLSLRLRRSIPLTVSVALFITLVVGRSVRVERCGWFLSRTVFLYDRASGFNNHFWSLWFWFRNRWFRGGIIFWVFTWSITGSVAVDWGRYRWRAVAVAGANYHQIRNE